MRLALAGPPGHSYIGIVFGLDGTLLRITAATCEALIAELGEYVRQRARMQLWPFAARIADELLAEGSTAKAVQLYFALVGDRWDEEWLVVWCNPSTCPETHDQR